MLRTPGVRQSLAEILDRQPWRWLMKQGLPTSGSGLSVMRIHELGNWQELKAWASRHSLLMLCWYSFQEVLQLREHLHLFLVKTPEFAVQKSFRQTNPWILAFVPVCYHLLLLPLCYRWLLKGLSFRVLPASNSFDDDGRGAQSVMIADEFETKNYRVTTSPNLL